MQELKLTRPSLNQLNQDAVNKPVAFFCGETAVVFRGKILRIIPNRRMVVAGEWRGQEVIIKIFFDSFRAKKHYQKEIKNHQLLTSLNVSAPSVLFHEPSQEDSKVFFIVFEKINAVGMPEDVLVREKGIKEIIYFVSECHKKGIFFIDPHPNNFIKSDHAIYLLDLTSVVFSKFNFKKAAKNLAYLASQMDTPSDEVVNNSITEYFNVLNGSAGESWADFVRKHYWEYCRKEEKKQLKKIFRSSTKYYRSFCDGANSIVLRAEKEFFPKRTDELDCLMNQGDFLKKGNTCTVSKIKIGEKCFVIKRYNIKNIFHRFKRAFQKSRAAKCWKSANLLLFYGFKTPRPVAMVERKKWFFNAESYYICDYCDGESAEHLFTQTEENEEILRFWMRKITDLMLKLKALCIKHDDMKINNFLIKAEDVYLIDIDGVKKMSYFFYRLTKSFEKGMRRMIGNWNNFPVLDKLFKEVLARRI